MGCAQSRFVSPQSGRIIVAQQFTAGSRAEGFVVSVFAGNPSDESLGYYQSSALRTNKPAPALLTGRTLSTVLPLDGLFPLFSFCRYNEPTCEQALHISNPLIANADRGLRSG
jgi:hypothetical protein